MAYKLRGVGRTFQTEEQVLSFLRHSPGYVRRRSAYLKRYWPGLAAQVMQTTGLDRQSLEGRSKKLRGEKPGRNVFDVIGEGAVALGRPVVEQAMQAAHGADRPQRGSAPKVPPSVVASTSGAKAALQSVGNLAVGPEITGGVFGEAVDPKWAAVEVAGLLPFGKPLRGLRAARAARVADEVPAAIKQAREGLKGAGALRKAQEAGYSVERASRAKKAEQAMQVGGVEGYRAALGELKGELPKLNFEGFSHLNKDAVDHLLTHVQKHKVLRPYQKVTVMDAVMKATEGRVPSRSELKLLKVAFGEEVARNLGDAGNLSLLKKTGNLVADAWNLPRSVIASFDLSAPFRQGLVAGARHPVIFARNFKPMVKAFGSQRVYEDVMDDIATRASFPLMKKGGLSLTDMGSDLTRREEQFFSHAADRLPGVKNSGRAYNAFLNKMRADVFDHLLGVAEKQGLDTRDPKFLKGIATYINSATGRGDLGWLQPAAVVLNSTLFSPRLMMSRFNFLNPAYYARLDPFARKQALRAALQTTGAVSTVLGLAYAAGARVNMDPRNADFAKVRVKDSRFDVAGGFQQPVRLMSQLASGKIVSSTTGRELTLGPQGPGKLSRKDITQRFFESKLAPMPSLVNDWLRGTNFIGEDFAWDQAIATRMIPLLAQDAYELYQHEEGGVNGIAAAFGAYGIGAFGVGFQTYGDENRSTRAPSYGKPEKRGAVSNKPTRTRVSNKP